MNSSEIRSRFLRFFEDNGHRVMPSSSLVPERDPTLYFTNAGMVQFKDVFTGAEKLSVSRAATSQKCLRVSGKHNDLEVVGRTARHHTFFEMLGNFSFGDYFKEEAIPFAWKLLTGPEAQGGFGIDPARLWVTIYEEDDEAGEIWTKKVGVRPERVQKLGAKDNFWSMGPTGPCGPCTEIHYDHGPAISSDERGPAGGDDRYVEIWNLVFMQYDQAADGTRTRLPRPSIDTGMGLERLAAVMQGKYWNYDTDLFQGVIKRIGAEAGLGYGGSASSENDVALRVIADHSRTAAFLVADGVMPSNEGRGYVLRRIMRRAIRYGVKIGLRRPFLFQGAETIIDSMGEHYPELQARTAFVLDVIKGEEERFSETLEKGLNLLDRELESRPGTLPGEVVFKLYDTFGFPDDLTALICEERGVAVDHAGFKAAMEAQKKLGRDNWKGSGDARLAEIQTELAAELSPTEFLGYTHDEARSVVLALVHEGQRAPALKAGQEGEIVLDHTPFYAESGGQVGDTGVLVGPHGHFKVKDVTKGRGDLFLHRGVVEKGEIKLGDPVEANVDASRRDRTRKNHTATHLLHAALRTVLGDHVQQKGSAVDPDRLRFDFSHHKAMSADELRQVEDLVYSEILRNTAVDTDVKGIAEAKAAGAMALFGEKYGDRVRVVSVPGFSVELCGGTHARRTGDIGLFRITSESGVAAGVRRVEAVTGPGALAFIRSRDNAAAEAAGKLRATPEGLPEAIDRLLAERKRLEKELEAAKGEIARAAAGDLASKVRVVNGIKVIAAEIPGDANVLRNEADRLRDQLQSGLVVLAAKGGDGVILIAAATKDLAGTKVHAGNIVKELAGMLGGRGGGRPDMAQAGGKDPSGIPAALERVYEIVAGA